MAGKRQANGTSFKPGAKPGPGRPKGAKTYAVRSLYAEALNDSDVRKEAIEQIKANLRARKTVVATLESAARINKEIGQGSDGAGPVVVPIVFMTNVDPRKLAAARSRALPLQAKVVG